MGTKDSPGKFDCHAAAAPDEPIFVLRSTDPLAPILVDLWASMRERERGDADGKAREARDVSSAMRRYRLNIERPNAPKRERDRVSRTLEDMARADGRCPTAQKLGGFTPPSGPADPGRVTFGTHPDCVEVQTTSVLPPGVAVMVGAEGSAAAIVPTDGGARIVQFDSAQIRREMNLERCSEVGCRNPADQGGVCRRCYFMNPDGDGDL